MSDKNLRRLERAAASGDPLAAARLLLEMVRQGQLSENQLRLMSFLGHENARTAAPSEPSSFRMRTALFARTLASYSEEGLMRGSCAALHFINSEFADCLSQSPHEKYALQHVETWFLCKSGKLSPNIPMLAKRNPRVAVQSTWGPQGFIDSGTIWFSKATVELAEGHLSSAQTLFANAYSILAKGANNRIAKVFAQMKVAAKEEIVSWALGADPLLERYNARGLD